MKTKANLRSQIMLQVITIRYGHDLNNILSLVSTKSSETFNFSIYFICRYLIAHRSLLYVETLSQYLTNDEIISGRISHVILMLSTKVLTKIIYFKRRSHMVQITFS